MNKKVFMVVGINSIIFLAVFGFGLIPAASFPASTVPGPAGKFASTFTLYNMNASAAQCSYNFYSQTIIYSTPVFTLPGNAKFYDSVFTPTYGTPIPGPYSGWVHCSLPVAVVVNQGNSGSADSYNASLAGSATRYAPVIYNNYYNLSSNIVVQNTSANSENITVQIYDQSGAQVATQTANGVAPNTAVAFEQNGLSGLGANTPYGAKISANGYIAAIVNYYGLSNTSADKELLTYTALASGSQTAYAPLNMKNAFGSGFNSAITVQNLGTATTNVTVTYGTGYAEKKSIPVNGSTIFFNTNLANGTYPTARIQSDSQPIVAVVSEANNYNRASAYTAILTPALRVIAPNVYRRYYTFNSSVACQNTGPTNTNLYINYTGVPTSTVIQNVSPNGQAIFTPQTEANLMDGFHGAAQITSTSQPIACVIGSDENEAPAATTIMDQFFSYEGVNAGGIDSYLPVAFPADPRKGVAAILATTAEMAPAGYANEMSMGVGWGYKWGQIYTVTHPAYNMPWQVVGDIRSQTGTITAPQLITWWVTIVSDPVTHLGCPSGSSDGLRQCAKDIAQRRQGLYWMIWNEPDLACSGLVRVSDCITPEQGARFFKEISDTIRGGDPTARLIVGNVANTYTTTACVGYCGVDWLSQFISQYTSLYGDPRNAISGYGFHDYAVANRECITPGSTLEQQSACLLENWTASALTATNWVAQNDANKEVWFTEMNWLAWKTGYDQWATEQSRMNLICNKAATLAITRIGWYTGEDPTGGPLQVMTSSLFMTSTPGIPTGTLSPAGEQYRSC